MKSLKLAFKICVLLCSLTPLLVHGAVSVVISQPKIKAPLPGKTTAVGYLNLRNNGDSSATLVGIRFEGDAVAEIHEHKHEDGMMRMRRLDSLSIPSGEAVEFKPGGYHVMVFQWQKAAVFTEKEPVANKINATLLFESGEEVAVVFDVVGW